PHATTVPSLSSARLWSRPAETALTPLRPLTGTGTSLASVPPLPSCPSKLAPQAMTAWGGSLNGSDALAGLVPHWSIAVAPAPAPAGERAASPLSGPKTASVASARVVPAASAAPTERAEAHRGLGS